MAQEHILSLYVSLISMTSLVLQQANSGHRNICLVTKPLNGINNCRRQDSCQGLLLHITNFQRRTRIDRMAMGLFSRRRWINRLAQKSSNYGMLPCMSSIIFGEPFILPTAYHLGRYCLHLLLLKRSMEWHFQVICLKVIQANPEWLHSD